MSLRGVENITVPSFSASARDLDEDGIRWDIRHAIDQGFVATLLALNAGLAPAEMKAFIDIAVDEAAGRLQVGLDMPLDSFALAWEVLEHGEAAGATHAVLGSPPSFAPGSDDEVHDAFAPFAAQTALRLVLPVGDIGLPARIGGGVPWGAWSRLAGHDSVRAIHITTWMPHVAFQALHLFSGRLEVGIGTPLLLGALPLLHREHRVAWLSPSHWELWQSPDRRNIVELLEHVLAGRKEEALAVHWRLAPALGIAFGAGLLEAGVEGMPHWPMAKYVSWSVGGNGGLVREPALRLKPHHLRARRDMLRAIGIEPSPDDGGWAAGRARGRVS
jgi:4-hydroxy-tetrahydrodipicolinate synthase